MRSTSTNRRGGGNGDRPKRPTDRPTDDGDATRRAYTSSSSSVCVACLVVVSRRHRHRSGAEQNVRVQTQLLAPSPLSTLRPYSQRARASTSTSASEQAGKRASGRACGRASGARARLFYAPPLSPLVAYKRRPDDEQIGERVSGERTSERASERVANRTRVCARARTRTRMRRSSAADSEQESAHDLRHWAALAVKSRARRIGARVRAERSAVLNVVYAARAWQTDGDNDRRASKQASERASKRASERASEWRRDKRSARRRLSRSAVTCAPLFFALSHSHA